MQSPADGSAFSDAHLHLYVRIARGLGFAPTRQMLDCLPEAGPLMFLRDDPFRWEQTRKAVHVLWPDIPAWTSKIADDNTRLASVPERIVYDVLNEIRPKEIRIVTHATFRGLKADFGLARGSGPAAIFIEVLGMIQRGGAPCNAEARNYQRKAHRKLAIYAENGVSPTLIYLDDVCNPIRLRALLHQAISQLEKAAS